MLRRRLRCSPGQASAEYAVLLVLISLVAIVILGTIGASVAALLGTPLAGF